jgi:hypothetical protein
LAPYDGFQQVTWNELLGLKSGNVTRDACLGRLLDDPNTVIINLNMYRTLKREWNKFKGKP